MPEDKVKKAARDAARYRANRGRAIETARQRRLVNKALVYERKARGCSKCGYNKCLAALDFDHRDPSQKVFHLGDFSCGAASAVIAEMDKCDVLCANCHRERTDAEKHHRFRKTA